MTPLFMIKPKPAGFSLLIKTISPARTELFLPPIIILF